MKIVINGHDVITKHTTLTDVIAEYGATPPYALAVNGEFVPKSDYHIYQVREQDRLDIVSPIFGG